MPGERTATVRSLPARRTVSQPVRLRARRANVVRAALRRFNLPTSVQGSLWGNGRANEAKEASRLKRALVFRVRPPPAAERNAGAGPRARTAHAPGRMQEQQTAADAEGPRS